jgi:hypothetical protein
MQFFGFLICLMTIGVSLAQETPIVFDRPGIADSPYLVQQKAWQIEAGVGYSAITGWKEVPNPTVMVRKTISKNDELRLTYNYGLQMIALIKDDMSTGFDHLALGWKRKLINEKNWLPEASFLLNTYFPMQLLNKIAHSGVYNVEAGFQFQNNLSKRFALNYNFGGLITNKYRTGVLTTSVCLNITGSDNIGFFVEGFLYAPFQSTLIEPGADIGIVYNPTERSQIDLSVIDNYYNGVHYATVLFGYSISLGRN